MRNPQQSRDVSHQGQAAPDAQQDLELAHTRAALAMDLYDFTRCAADTLQKTIYPHQSGLAAGDPAIIDLTVLARLVSHDRAKVRKFSLKFLQTSEQGVDAMQRALTAGDLDKLGELGHRLKSSARVVGAFGLAALCQQLEDLPSASEADIEVALAQARAYMLQMHPLLEQISYHIVQLANASDDS